MANGIDIKKRIQQAKKEAKDIKANILRIQHQKDDGEISEVAAGRCAVLRDQQLCRRRLRGHHGKIYDCCWGGDSDIVTISQDGKMIVWDAFTALKTQAFSLGSAWIMACAFEPTQQRFVACGGLDNICSLYQLGQPQTQRERSATMAECGMNRKSRASKELVGHDGYISCCRFFDEQTMITSSGDTSCILWDIERAEAKMRFMDHCADVMKVAISPTDKNVFISISADCSAKMWDIRTEKCSQTFVGHEGDLTDVEFFPDGQAVGTASEDSSCRLFDARACGEVCKYENDSIMCGVTSLSFSKSGRLLVAGYDDCQVRVWDTLSSAGNHLWELADDRLEERPHEDRVSCLQMNATGEAICSGSWDSTLKIWA